MSRLPRPTRSAYRPPTDPTTPTVLRRSPPIRASPRDRPRPTGWRGLAVTFLMAAAFPLAFAALAAPVVAAAAAAGLLGAVALVRIARTTDPQVDLRLPLPGGLALDVALARR